MEQALVAQPLSQVERVVDTYVAPSKTFTDLLRSTSWWLPLIVLAVCTVLNAFAVDKKVGFEAAAQQQMEQNSFQQSQMAALSPAQREVAIGRAAKITRIVTYVSFLFILVFAAFAALLNWATINFGFGAKTTYGQNFALQMYGGLPLAIKGLLSAALLFAGVGTESFNLNNPVGTNPGYYLTDAAKWIKTLLTFFDVLGLWSLVLIVLGLAIISGKSKGQAAAVVVGWWLVVVLVITGLAAVTG